MARPKKEQGLAYTHHVNLRLTDVQYTAVSEAAKKAHLSLSEYIRTQLAKGKVITRYEITVDVPQLRKLTAEFGRIGSNLNQIARHFNQGGVHSQEMRAAISRCMAQVHEMKYEALKMAGGFPADGRWRTDASKGGPHGNTEAHCK